MLNVSQYRTHVVDPALTHIGLYSRAASNLVLGTHVYESKLKHLVQLPNGPALGMGQMEPASFDDLWYRYLDRHLDLKLKALDLVTLRWLGEPGATEMIGNMYFACAMTRIKYFSVPAPLPRYDDILGMARYYKQYYNTELGKGTAEGYMEDYNLYIKEV